MIRLWILVLTLSLLTGSAYGSVTFWLSLLGLGPAMGSPLPAPLPAAPPIIFPPGFAGYVGGGGGDCGSCDI
ncbi:inhibin beta B chain-like [Drosophila innubila]|uniref:inhibin beta B chain-like n=1 Tax=Drosophila innubila TaxID=198719 RepID=UPI00148D070D|nr:inhibin beta B chain-like [Drosophila innubila]